MKPGSEDRRRQRPSSGVGGRAVEQRTDQRSVPTGFGRRRPLVVAPFSGAQFDADGVGGITRDGACFVDGSARARVTPTRRWPCTLGLPNRRTAVSGTCSAAATLLKYGTPSPCASNAHDADGPLWRITGIGRPRMARACSANSLSSCDTSVTRPVSCGRGDTSLNHTSSPFTNSSTPNRPQPPRSSVIARESLRHAPVPRSTSAAAASFRGNHPPSADGRSARRTRCHRHGARSAG